MSGSIPHDWTLVSSRTLKEPLRSGLVIGTQVHDIARILRRPELADMSEVIAHWSTIEHVLDEFATTGGTGRSGVSIDEVTLGPPLPHPGAIFCAAANFRDHMQAMAAKLGIEPEPDPHDLDVHPYHFLKPTRQTISGPDASVALPAHASNVDWEIELVAVIGRPAREVSVANALDHVAGYTVGNDLSVRDRAYMKRPNVPDGSLFRTDFLGMKGFDGSCPIGPCIVPARDIADPQSLRMRLMVDDELRQDSSTSMMIFSVAEQIAHLSRYCTLLPGDLVLTGTPAGTGAENDTFLRRGQVLSASIEKIGELTTQIV